jgi:UDP-glucuronate 4-epimerase
VKVLVTGGAGFIGSHVCDALIKRGDHVICVDNFNDYYDPSIKEKNVLHNLDNKDYTLYRADIVNLGELKPIFEKEKPDQLIHLAARAGVRPSINNPHLYQEVNIKGTLNLLELAKEFNVKSFVFASSSSVYGNREGGPFWETDDANQSISPYAATKRAGELLCYTYHHLYKLDVACLRFFTVYGPRGRPDMAPLKFTQMIDQGKIIQVYGDGLSQRDYTYITDIVVGVLSALDNNKGYEIFNLGNSHPITLNDFIFTIESHLGKKSRRVSVGNQPGDVNITFANIEKSKNLLGYNPQVGINEGTRSLVKWYQDNNFAEENKR